MYFPTDPQVKELCFSGLHFTRKWSFETPVSVVKAQHSADRWVPSLDKLFDLDSHTSSDFWVSVHFWHLGTSHFQFQVQSARGLERIIPPAPHTLHMKCDLLGPLTSQEGGGWTIQLFPPPVLLLIDTINIM